MDPSFSLEAAVAEVQALRTVVERLRSALHPFARYVEENDLSERSLDDVIEVPVVNLLAASLAFDLWKAPDGDAPNQ